MQSNLTGAVLITGASSGIGRDCALRLDELGFRVFAGVRGSRAADELATAGSARLMPVRLDITDAESIEAARGVISDDTGGALDGLVNNAGIALAGPLEFLPIEAFRTQLEVNVVGQLAVTQAFLPLLRRARGRIVNMGSISGRFAPPFVAPYAASKYALEALTDSLRLELRPWGIGVSIIEPGAIATPIWERSRAVAEEIGRGYPPEAAVLYGDALEGLAARVARLKETAPRVVTQAVIHALTARRPRARYVVGRDAKIRLAVARLPTRWRDLLVARAIGSR